jgi:hypothetical protein
MNLSFPSPLQEWDVLVVGGGAAGVFAAISAAKTGAKTLLIEKNSVLGGTITTAGVNFPGLFYAWGKQIISGPCWDAISRTVELGGAVLPTFSPAPKYHYDEQISLNNFIYSFVLDEMSERAGVTVLLHTTLGALQPAEDGYFATLSQREGLSCIKAKTIVDATGDAAAVGLLNLPRVKSASVQPATLIHNLSGYDPDKLDMDLLKKRICGWISEGRLKKEDFQGDNIAYSLKTRRIFMHLSGQEADTSAGKSLLERQARSSLMRIVLCLRNFPGLEKLTVSYCAPECGVRETFRIVGEKNITVEEYINGVVYDDAICYCFYPVDRHIPEGIHQIFLKPGVIPTIPYGALIPKGASRILAAGRCISGDADANSAYRVQAPCMATGQAAGVAAALAAVKGCTVQQVPYQEICEKLKTIGATVPTR